MAIRFQCPKCQNPISVGDKYAGGMRTCNRCRMKLRIPKRPDRALRKRKLTRKSDSIFLDIFVYGTASIVILISLLIFLYALAVAGRAVVWVASETANLVFEYLDQDEKERDQRIEAAAERQRQLVKARKDDEFGAARKMRQPRRTRNTAATQSVQQLYDDLPEGDYQERDGDPIPPALRRVKWGHDILTVRERFGDLLYGESEPFGFESFGFEPFHGYSLSISGSPIRLIEDPEMEKVLNGGLLSPRDLAEVLSNFDGMPVLYHLSRMSDGKTRVLEFSFASKTGNTGVFDMMYCEVAEAKLFFSGTHATGRFPPWEYGLSRIIVTHSDDCSKAVE